jgi:mono/diheme cytochrome c family protein
MNFKDMNKNHLLNMKFAVAFMLPVLCATAFSGPLPEMTVAQTENDTKIEEGRRLYKQYCEVCHGVNMNSGSSGAFDLRGFPVNQQRRFMNSVANGKNTMPPWKSVLSPTEIESLFWYVTSHKGN